MKNFKLLLASTAILSTTLAMGANAGVVGQDTLAVPVSAEVIRPLSLGYTQKLDFGRVIASNDYAFSVIMNGSGTSINGPGGADGYAYVLEQGKAAIITGATCDQIQLPNFNEDTGGSRINLTNPAGAPASNKAQIRSLACDTVNEQTVIYGTLEFGNSSKAEGERFGTVYPGVYTGEFTITAIYPDDTRDTTSGD